MDTKKLRQKILDLAIRGKLVPQDPNDEPASVLLERIKAEKERLIKEGKIKRSKKTAKTSDTPHYENVPFEVPKGWVWTTIEEICSKIGSGSTPKGSNYSVKGIPFFRSQNVYNDRLVYDDIKYISEEVHQKMKGTEVLANDLLLNITGGSLGRCAVVPADFNCGNVSQHVCIMRSVLVEPEYFHALVLSSYFAKSMKITGSGREGLPKYNLEQMGFPLPPLTEQQRIVTEIEHWFALLGQIEKGKLDLQNIIKQTKSKVLDIAIHGKLVPQDPNEEPAIELLKRINPDFTPCDNGHYTQLPFEVPQNWSWTTLGKIGKWQSGSTPNRLNKDYYNGNIPWLKTGDLNDGYITHIPEYITEKALNETSVKLNPTGSVLIAMYGATIGKIGILTFPATTNQACCACEVFNGIDREFIFLFLLSHREEFIKMGGGGAQPNISKEKIINTYIPLPPFTEQKRIINVVNKIFAQLDAIMESL
ncbi:restriction endonuclease subunit S [Bacteroides caecigallinarum]|uniref:restriction endonuclease subunit S n=1 Tax=Bacteroides caecigallinarum TaxID=1411144 RepID=UPI0019588A64|nr:restriction endonuclease subunit S [Bacteroides caecigallinarum]MBM6961137.1 restriction endonuclease subunit S [Bacteroides caecigallinarum]